MEAIYQRAKEPVIYLVLFLCALLSVCMTIGIIAILFSQSSGFFETVSVKEFLFGTEWTPLFEPQSFGVLPLLGGTLLVALLSLIIAVPVGLGIAIFLSQYASKTLRKYVKPILELLAGIPSVVYGYFAIITISPFLQSLYPNADVFNAMNAAIVLAIMVLPVIASIGDDALSALPKTLSESGYACGATSFEVIWHILLPGASSGIIAAIILGFSRAIGETMAVTLAAGATPNLTINPFESIQTMTSYIVQVSMGDVVYGSVQYKSIFAVALLLFVMTFMMNLSSNIVLKKLKSRFH